MCSKTIDNLLKAHKHTPLVIGMPEDSQGNDRGVRICFSLVGCSFKIRKSKIFCRPTVKVASI